MYNSLGLDMFHDSKIYISQSLLNYLCSYKFNCEVVILT